MTIRMLLPVERTLFADHLKRLEWNDRLMRFESSVSDEYIDRYVAGISPQDTIIGLFDDAGTLRGAAHCAYRGDIADLGLSIEASYRRQGNGTALLNQAVDSARFRANHFSSQCLTHNRWMMTRLQRMGFEIEVDYDTAHSAELNPADMALTYRAITEEHMGWLSYGAKLFFRPHRSPIQAAA